MAKKRSTSTGRRRPGPKAPPRPRANKQEDLVRREHTRRVRAWKAFYDEFASGQGVEPAHTGVVPVRFGEFILISHWQEDVLKAVIPMHWTEAPSFVGLLSQMATSLGPDWEPLYNEEEGTIEKPEPDDAGLSEEDDSSEEEDEGPEGESPWLDDDEDEEDGDGEPEEEDGTPRREVNPAILQLVDDEDDEVD